MFEEQAAIIDEQLTKKEKARPIMSPMQTHGKRRTHLASRTSCRTVASSNMALGLKNSTNLDLVHEKPSSKMIQKRPKKQEQDTAPTSTDKFLEDMNVFPPDFRGRLDHESMFDRLNRVSNFAKNLRCDKHPPKTCDFSVSH